MAWATDARWRLMGRFVARPARASVLAVALTLSALSVSPVNAASEWTSDLRVATFLSAGDAVRTALGVYWWDSARSGVAHLPTQLAQLGDPALFIDPWTGQADWETVRRADGGIVAVYSRSHHPVSDPEALAQVAELRPGLTEEQRRQLGVSAWMFRWQPPAAKSVKKSMAMLHAIDALQGRWPGQLPGDRVADLFDRPSRASVASPAYGARGGGGLAAGRAAPLPVLPPSPSAALAPAIVATVPVEDAEAATQGARARIDSASVALAAGGGADAPITAPANEGAQPALAPYVFSDNPRVRRCEMGLGIAQASQGACREAYQSRDEDAGIAWDNCMRDLELSVALCAAQR